MTTKTTDPPKAPGAVEEAEGIYAKASPPSLITRYFSDGGSLNKVPSDGMHLQLDQGKSTADKCGDRTQATTPIETESRPFQQIPAGGGSTTAPTEKVVHALRAQADHGKRDNWTAPIRQEILDPDDYPDTDEVSDPDEHPYYREKSQSRVEDILQKEKEDDQGEEDDSNLSGDDNFRRNETQEDMGEDESSEPREICAHSHGHGSAKPRGLVSEERGSSYCTKVSSHRPKPRTVETSTEGGDDPHVDPRQDTGKYNYAPVSTARQQEKRLDPDPKRPRESYTPRRMLDDPQEQLTPQNQLSGKAEARLTDWNVIKDGRHEQRKPQVNSADHTQVIGPKPRHQKR